MQSVVALEDLVQIEIFETAFRILLTPMPVIERLKTLIIQPCEPDFNRYLFKIITDFKATFVRMLSKSQHAQWLSWITQHGLRHLKNYMHHVTHFHVNTQPLLTPTLSVEMMHHLLLSGIEFNIPHLQSIMSMKQIRGLTLAHQAQIFDYLIDQFENNWATIAHQPHDALWVFTCEFVAFFEKELKQGSSQIDIGDHAKPFLCHFMMTCMLLGKYTLVDFLLSQESTLVHVPIQEQPACLPEQARWLNLSL